VAPLHAHKKYVKLANLFAVAAQGRLIPARESYDLWVCLFMKRVLIFVGASPLFCSAVWAGQRQIAVAPPPRSARLVQPSGLRVALRANAQLVDVSRAQAVQIEGNTLTLAPGEVVLLPFSSVTRIITDDDDVARAFFQNGAPVLQALGTGTTTVEIYQSSGTPRVLSVTVDASKTPSSPRTLPAPAVTPAPLVTPALAPVPLPQTIPVPEATPSPAPPSGLTTTIPAAPDLGSGSGGKTPDVAVPEIGDPLLPQTLPTPIPTAQSEAPPIVPSSSGLLVQTRVLTAPDDASQAQFFVSFSNRSTSPARGVVVRFPLDARVKLVPGSVTSGGTFDEARRELVWRVGDLDAHSAVQSASFRVVPISRGAFSFASSAIIEDSIGDPPVTSPQVQYSTNTTPLLTVFALPDRFLAGVNRPRFTDVDYGQSLTVERLKQLDITQGVGQGKFGPTQPTKRAEYAVMTLKGLGLRDLRELTQLKFVLSRRSTVSLYVQSANGTGVADLVRGTAFEAGEHTAMWNGKTARGDLAPAGKYTYVCSAKDARGETTTLRGYVQVVTPQSAAIAGVPTFVDVKTSDWFAGYLAAGEKQNLLYGYKDGTFRPLNPISRVEATAIVVRALGLSDVAAKWADKDVGFVDYAQIPAWARGDVNAATTVAKTGTGNPIMRGTVDNRFLPLENLTRAQAALIVSRLIDRETTRRLTISGAIVPGAVVSINSRPVSADGNGQFSFSLDLLTSTPTTLSVIDTRSNVY